MGTLELALHIHTKLKQSQQNTAPFYTAASKALLEDLSEHGTCQKYKTYWYSSTITILKGNAFPCNFASFD